MKINKRKMIIIIGIFIVGIILISIGLIMTKNLNTPENPNNNQSSGELLGEEREKVTNEIIEIIEKYLEDKEKIKEYLDKKDTKTISMQEIKENLNINISEFENIKYGCNDAFTTIDYNEDYSEHVINLTCEVLFKK